MDMNSMMLAFLRFTAWEMPVLRPYGTMHLFLLLVFSPMAAVLAWKLRDFGEKVIVRILFWTGVTLIVTEVYKELFLSFIVEGRYCYGDFPFQLCSMPMYLCPLLPVLARKHRNVCYAFLGTFNLLGGIAAVLEPSASFYPYITMTVHSVLWHQVLIFIGCLLCFSGLSQCSRTAFQKAVLLYMIFCGIAYGLNALLMESSNGSMNLFFIGPGDAPIVIMNRVSRYWGAVPETLLMMAATILGSIILALCAKFLSHHRQNSFQSKKTHATQ